MLRNSDAKGTLTRIIQTLRWHGPTPRMELAELTGLSRATITSAVQDLTESGLVRETTIRKRTGGRPAVCVEIVPQTRRVLGAYLSNQHWTLGVFDLFNHVYEHHPIATDLKSPEACLRSLVEAVGQLRDRVGAVLPVIGVGVPGLVDVTQGVVISAPDIGWQNVPFARMLSDALALDVIAVNRHRAFGLAECRYATDHRSLTYVGVGSGIAAGLYVDRQLVPGALGGAGEIGHNTVEPGGLLCGCGNTGCLQMYANADALEREFRRRVKLGEISVLTEPVMCGVPTDVRQVHAEDICLAAERGDPLSRSVIRDAATYLGIMLANVVNSVNPEAVVLGGSLPSRSPFYVQVAAEVMRQRALSPLGDATVVTAADLPEYAGALGSCTYALDRQLSFAMLSAPSGNN